MASTPAPDRKLPRLEPDTAFYWTAGAEGTLRIQACRTCDTYQHPPLPRCASCGSEDVAPRAVSGKGRVASFTVNQQAWVQGLEVPFVFAVVELEEQAQLYVFTNIDSPPEAVRTGLPVSVYFAQHEDVWLPMFRIDDAVSEKAA